MKPNRRNVQATIREHFKPGDTFTAPEVLVKHNDKVGKNETLSIHEITGIVHSADGVQKMGRINGCTVYKLMEV